MQKRILVLGGTGRLGKPTAHQLAIDGFQVRVLARDIEKARTNLDDSIEIVEGDATDKDSLEKALHDCTGVHISLGNEAELPAAQQVAAQAHNLERITYTSGATVSEANRWFPMVDAKFRAEAAIRDSGVPYTIFCPTWFMEMLPMFIQRGRATIIGKHKTPYHWVAANDFAKMVSASYQSQEAANKRFYVHGPEAILMKTALQQTCTVLAPEVTSVTVMPLWLAAVIGRLTGNEMLRYAAKLMGYFTQAGEGGDPSEANRILSAPTTTLAVWLEDKKQNNEHARAI